MGLEPYDRSCMAFRPSFVYRWRVEVLGEYKSQRKKNQRIPKAAAVWTRKEDSILQVFKDPQGK